MRGATRRTSRCACTTRISIHAPHAGRDRNHSTTRLSIFLFQSTRPMRGATTNQQNTHSQQEFQSTRPMRGATTPCGGSSSLFSISIHAPHAGRDGLLQGLRGPRRISIHAPHAGRDWPGTAWAMRRPIFQSTRPMRGATVEDKDYVDETINFNPRAPCGARQDDEDEAPKKSKFQSTRPMRGATRKQRLINASTRNFNPRAPCGARRLIYDRHTLQIKISIHAPHAGRDG